MNAPAPITALGPIARAGQRHALRHAPQSLSFEFGPPKTPELEESL